MTKTESIQGFIDEFSDRISFEIPKHCRHKIIIKLLSSDTNYKGKYSLKPFRILVENNNISASQIIVIQSNI
jgi:hypothetical protein